MKNSILSPRQSLNKAFLKLKPIRKEIEIFKENFRNLLAKINPFESEEFNKNLIADFLKNTYYSPNFFINTKGRNDLVIHKGKDAKDTVGVIIEAKKPTNRLEMLKPDNLNTKAFHELILYFMRERFNKNNQEITYLIATNIHEWFIFDVATFDNYFAHNKEFVKQFQDFQNGQLDFLSDVTTIHNLIDFADYPVFEEAIAYPSIIIVNKNKPRQNQVKVMGWDKSTEANIKDFPRIFQNNHLSLDQHLLKPEGWQLESPQVLQLLDKLRNTGTLLGEYVENRFYRGILTGLNEAFIVDQETRDNLIN